MTECTTYCMFKRYEIHIYYMRHYNKDVKTVIGLLQVSDFDSKIIHLTGVISL